MESFKVGCVIFVVTCSLLPAAADTSSSSSKMGKKLKRGKAGNAVQYLTRNQAIKKLQLRLSEFRWVPLALYNFGNFAPPAAAAAVAGSHHASDSKELPGSIYCSLNGALCYSCVYILVSRMCAHSMTVSAALTGHTAHKTKQGMSRGLWLGCLYTAYAKSGGEHPFSTINHAAAALRHQAGKPWRARLNSALHSHHTRHLPHTTLDPGR